MVTPRDVTHFHTVIRSKVMATEVTAENANGTTKSVDVSKILTSEYELTLKTNVLVLLYYHATMPCPIIVWWENGFGQIWSMVLYSDIFWASQK